METLQEKFDAMVAEYGAGAVIEAVKAHAHPDGDGNCQQTGCPPHYVCSTTTGNCVLDIGG